MCGNQVLSFPPPFACSSSIEVLYPVKAIHLVQANTLEPADLPEPGDPAQDEVLLDILSVGICGSDLHMYATGGIGGIKSQRPHILGHEFCARIRATGANARDEHGNPLQAGQRVAVEPHVACGHCEQCLSGHPNLCPNHTFYGVYPTHGALRERMLVKAKQCYPIPETISDAGGALLETLGVALHSLDLGRLRIGDTVAVIGCGPVGALIARLAVLSGASHVYAFDTLPWRVELAAKWGAEAHLVDPHSAPQLLQELTQGRGVDVAIEAAWADHSVQQSIEMARFGGRAVMVGISPEDTVEFSQAIARRKGLTIRMARRMKHTYPRAIALACGPDPRVDLDELATHFYPLEQADRAFRENAAYAEGLLKGILCVAGRD